MFFKNSHIPILTYHNILENNATLNDCHDWITINDFKSQIALIKSHHFTPISFGELFNTTKPLPNKPIIITFDDGYESCYSIVYHILKEYNFKASYFIFTDFIAESPVKRLSNDWNIGYRPKTNHLVWTEIREMIDSGLVEIGSHTQSHKSLTNIELHDVEKELCESKKNIENNLGRTIDFFSYPGGHGFNNDQIKKLVKKEYLGAVSAFPSGIEHLTKMDRWAIKRIEINQSTIIDTNSKTRAKDKLITKIYPLLFFVSKFNSLSWLANFLIRFYR